MLQTINQVLLRGVSCWQGSHVRFIVKRVLATSIYIDLINPQVIDGSINWNGTESSHSGIITQIVMVPSCSERRHSSLSHVVLQLGSLGVGKEA